MGERCNFFPFLGKVFLANRRKSCHGSAITVRQSPSVGCDGCTGDFNQIIKITFSSKGSGGKPQRTRRSSPNFFSFVFIPVILNYFPHGTAFFKTEKKNPARKHRDKTNQTPLVAVYCAVTSVESREIRDFSFFPLVKPRSVCQVEVDSIRAHPARFYEDKFAEWQGTWSRRSNKAPTTPTYLNCYTESDATHRVLVNSRAAGKLWP